MRREKQIVAAAVGRDAVSELASCLADAVERELECCCKARCCKVVAKLDVVISHGGVGGCRGIVNVPWCEWQC